MNIAREWNVFTSAIWSGIFLLSLYWAIDIIRMIIKHPLWMINIEDVLYWTVAAGYLFVQIYHTNNGIIRGYYVLGVVLGAVASWKIIRFCMKMWKKFVHSKKEKRVDKLQENR